MSEISSFLVVQATRDLFDLLRDSYAEGVTERKRMHFTVEVMVIEISPVMAGSRAHSYGLHGTCQTLARENARVKRLEVVNSALGTLFTPR